MIKASTAIKDYIRQMRGAGYAKATVRSHAAGLKAFERFLEKHRIADIRQVSAQTIEAFKIHIMNTQLAPASKALRLRPVKGLFAYLVLANRLLCNPGENLLTALPCHRRIGPVLTPGQMARLMTVADMTTPVSIRNRAVMEVLYSTGIRVGELIGLQTADVNMAERMLFIRRGKGACQRMVPFARPCGHILSIYLEKVRPRFINGRPETAALFLTARGIRLTEGAIRHFLAVYRRKAGIQPPVSPHVFRRSCATHFMQNGAGIRFVQQLLGHASLKVTHRYTRVMPVALKQTHEKTHPGVRDAPD